MIFFLSKLKCICFFKTEKISGFSEISSQLCTICIIQTLWFCKQTSPRERQAPRRPRTDATRLCDTFSYIRPRSSKRMELLELEGKKTAFSFVPILYILFYDSTKNIKIPTNILYIAADGILNEIPSASLDIDIVLIACYIIYYKDIAVYV